MYRFSPDDVDDRKAAIQDIATITKNAGGEPVGLDEYGKAMDLPKKFKSIWNMIGQVQTCDAPPGLMDKLDNLPQGRFFGNFVNRTGEEDEREYKYILNFMLATTCEKNDTNCEFIRIIGENKCVYGSNATPLLTWYDVLRIIFTYMYDNNIIDHSANPDPYPDFMNYIETDPSVCGKLPPVFVPTNVCKSSHPAPNANNKVYRSSSSSSSSSSSWSTKNLVCLLLIAIVALILLFNPLTFKLTNNLGGYTTTSNGPTLVGYSIHGIILIGILVCLYLFFPRK